MSYAIDSCPIGNLVAELTSGRFPMFSTLVELATYAGVAEALANTQDITVLCPTNDAFTRAGITCSPPMLGNKMLTPREVKDVLMTHVLLHRRPQLRHINGSAGTINGKFLLFEHDADNRTIVRHGNSVACVLMQGFTSSNASFAGIGRVLL